MFFSALILFNVTCFQIIFIQSIQTSRFLHLLMYAAGSIRVDVFYPHIKKGCHYTFDIHTYIFNLILGFCEYIKKILSFQITEFLTSVSVKWTFPEDVRYLALTSKSYRVIRTTAWKYLTIQMRVYVIKEEVD